MDTMQTITHANVLVKKYVLLKPLGEGWAGRQNLCIAILSHIKHNYEHT